MDLHIPYVYGVAITGYDSESVYEESFMDLFENITSNNSHKLAEVEMHQDFAFIYFTDESFVEKSLTYNNKKVSLENSTYLYYIQLSLLDCRCSLQ